MPRDVPVWSFVFRACLGFRAWCLGFGVAVGRGGETYLFGALYLELVWDFVLGAWDLGWRWGGVGRRTCFELCIWSLFGISCLVLGIWGGGGKGWGKCVYSPVITM